MRSRHAGSHRGVDAIAESPDALRGLGLTRREAEVLYWIAQGKTNLEVTMILATGMPAVKKHLSRIYEKLGVENRMAAAAAARRRTAAWTKRWRDRDVATMTLNSAARPWHTRPA